MMPAKFKDITGQKYHMLTAIKRVGQDKNHRSIWLWKCDCGNYKEIPISNVIKSSPTTYSCGCYNLSLQKIRLKDHIIKTHGMSRTRIYATWKSMIDRCKNEKHVYYKNYGGRGIKVCDEWKHFEPFYEWAIPHGYTDDLTIERIDVNGDYCPENCTWIPQGQQARNTTRTRKIKYKGEIYLLTDLADMLGFPRAYYYRYKNTGLEDDELVEFILERYKKRGDRYKTPKLLRDGVPPVGEKEKSVDSAEVRVLED